LLQEQRLAQQVEAERAKSHRVKMEHLFDEFGARVKHTEMGLEALRQEAAAMPKRIRALEQRAMTWYSTQERVESVQAELFIYLFSFAN
jgi:chromosome condensin MukBEF ATPase and DNA-binding subunit MukB